MEKPIENEPQRRRAYISWRWLAIASLLIIALIAAFFIAKSLRGSRVDRGTRALVRAFSERRLIEPRLSGGFKGGRFTPSNDVASGIRTLDYDQGRELIEDAAANGERFSRLAYARLLLSKGERLPEARKYLQRELASESKHAEAHNDLGVCLILQGKTEDALDEFEAALMQKADMPEALFNRAICYDQLLLTNSAGAEYTRAMTVEREPGWRAEIKHRQESLVPHSKEGKVAEAFDEAMARGDTDEAKRLTAENFEPMLKYALGPCTDSYLKVSVAGDSNQAERSLKNLELIGNVFLDSHDDSLIADLANHLRGLESGARAIELARVGEYREAEKLYGFRKYPEAQNAFERLSKAFAQSGNGVFQISSELYSAGCLYGSGHFRSSIEQFRTALSSTEGHRWHYSRAQGASQMGSAYARLGRDSLAIKFCQQAINHGSGMPLFEAKTLQYIGNSYWHLGDLEKSLVSLRQSTRMYLANLPARADLAYNYLQLADIYRLRGNHALALLNAQQVMTLTQPDDYNRLAQTSSFIAMEHARLGESDQAEKELAEAFNFLEKTDPGQRAYSEPLVLARAGEIAVLADDVERAIAGYEKAEKIVEKSEEQINLIRVLRGRSEAYARAREFDKARLDLERAIRLIEGYRAGIANTADRSAFLDVSQSVFDQLIVLNASSLGRQAEAFDFSEQSRARALLDEALSLEKNNKAQGAVIEARQNGLDKRTQGTPLNLARVQAALPEDLRLLTYSVTSQRTYLFLVTRSGFEVTESPVTTEMLDGLVQRYLSDLKDKAPLEELSPQAAKLYEYLIAPVEARLADGKALCIVPDKSLHFLPFSALVDGAGEYLIKSRRLTYAPSASVLVRCIDEARVRHERSAEKILVVGNPQFDRDAFPALPNLEDAEREALDSAAQYKESVILNGPDATEARLRVALGQCDVAHLAAHCLVDEKSPWLAALVLSKPTGVDQRLRSSSESSPDDGMLYLDEVYGIGLLRTRLVVLSACQSGLGQYYRGEGIVSLIHPFLAARVPTVVASLWSIDSRATAALMIEFHRERKTSNPQAGDALRAAQIKMIDSETYSHPFYWAQFIAVGSNS